MIGTHRLLSKDMQYKNLGLLVIDEEQRFGVTHKEKIKTMKKDVDVLSLSATPIPRTLHMSLIGIRDMSVLEEPPHDRRAIQTYVMEYNEELVKEAVYREMTRGGQVYYVYNRVNNIAEVTAELQRLLPDAKVAFAHGQMKERELEEIMMGFMNHRDRTRYSECKYNDHSRCQPAWVVPVVSVKRTCRKIESKCICIFDVQKKHTVKRNRRKTITGNPGIYRSGIRL